VPLPYLRYHSLAMQYSAFVKVRSLLDTRWKAIRLRSGIYMGVKFTLQENDRYESDELSAEQVARLTAKPLEMLTVVAVQDFQQAP
jgi:hypothetical protein